MYPACMPCSPAPGSRLGVFTAKAQTIEGRTKLDIYRFVRSCCVPLSPTTALPEQLAYLRGHGAPERLLRIRLEMNTIALARTNYLPGIEERAPAQLGHAPVVASQRPRFFARSREHIGK